MGRLADINLGKRTKAKTAIVNAGKIFTGDIAAPLADGDAVMIQDGKIRKVGFSAEMNLSSVDHTIDLNGMTIAPGLIDPHTHFEFNDYNFFFRKQGWMEDCFIGGVTTMVDEGCPCEIKGRPMDSESVTALALLLRNSHRLYRPGGGLKAHGGALVLERGLTEDHFRKLAKVGCFMIAEVGGGGLYEYEDIEAYLQLGRKYGFVVNQHFGGAAIPGGATMTAKDVLKTRPDVLCHSNGGPTSPSWRDLREVIDETSTKIELIFNGNQKTMVTAADYMNKQKKLNRIIVGTDSPVGLGTQAVFGTLRTVVNISALAGIPAEQAICFATGNTAKTLGLNTGMIKEGREADILALGRPLDSTSRDAKQAIDSGDVPSVAMIMVDGELARISPFPYSDQVVKVDGIERPIYTLESWIYGPPGSPFLPREQKGSYNAEEFKPLGKPRYRN